MRNGFFVDRGRPCKIFYFTKLTGDVAANLDTLLQTCKKVTVLAIDGVTVVAATFTQGSGAPGSFTTALAALGAGTSGFIVCEGNKLTH
jgi:hypothetical protein